MTTYAVTTANWNSPSFWLAISEGAAGHTLDFSALPASFTVDMPLTSNIITLSDGTTTFTIGEAGVAGTDANLGGATQLESFDVVLGGAGNDSIAGGDGGVLAFNDLATDPNVSIDSTAHTITADSYQVTGGAQQGSITFAHNQGDLDTLNVSFTFDVGSNGHGNMSFGFGDPAARLPNDPGYGIQDSGLNIIFLARNGNDDDVMQILWNGSTLGTYPLGTWDIHELPSIDASLIVSDTGLVTFNLPGTTVPSTTVQIPGTQWQDADTSNYEFIYGSALSNWNYISDVQFSGLPGLPSDDSIEGGAGDDTIDGGEGNDTLIGGAGNDSVTADRRRDGRNAGRHAGHAGDCDGRCCLFRYYLYGDLGHRHRDRKRDGKSDHRRWQ